MKTLYLECNMGAAGDMLMAALLELCPDPAGMLSRLNALGLPGVEVSAAPAVKCGITGTHVSVRVNGAEEESGDAHEHGHEHDHEHKHAHEHEHAHEHAHRGMGEIEALLASLPVSDKVKGDALAVYRLLAEAESAVHARPVSEIHFHEVGNMDAVTDVVGVCMLMEAIAPAQVLCSPVHVGSGQTRCAHGLLPVPAPATARLLQGAPVYGGKTQGELCTPTGAALLRYFVSAYGDMPVMRLCGTGYGMGTKDFPAANCLRAMLGETEEAGDEAVELCCNLDDMTPEAIGFALERLLEGGALDAYTVPIGMKKSRPGVLLCCLCHPARREALRKLLFLHTSTLGVREYACKRHILRRSERRVETPAGTVRIKAAEGFGVSREKPEYEDMARIARERGCSLEEVRELLKKSRGAL